MDDKELLRQELSKITLEFMDRYWKLLNRCTNLDDHQFEKLCKIGCDLEMELNVLADRAAEE